MNERPLVAFVCCWLLGVSVPSLWQGWGQYIALGGAALLIAGFALTGRLTLRLTAACLAAMGIAYAERIWVDLRAESELALLWERSTVPDMAELTGIIAAAPEIDGDAVTFRLTANRLKIAVTGEDEHVEETVLVRVKLKERAEIAIASDWKRGDRVRVAGSPEMPGDAGNFGAFDYRAFLERQGIQWQWSVQGAEAVALTNESVPARTLPLRWVDGLRQAIGRLMDGLYPGSDAGYMKGLVAGITNEVDPALYDAYSRLGLTHVLAISGLHVAVVVFMLLRLGAMCRLTRERSIDITIAAMPVYMLLTGASPSAVRACLMAMIALALARKDRLKDGLHLLAAAAWLMTAWDPSVVENVSFQLSFAVTAGLLLGTSKVAVLLRFIRFKFVRDALAVAITAQAASFPLTVYYFHGFHLLSLPANLALVPFISFAILPLGMASVLLGAAWQPLGSVPALLATYGNKATFALVDWLDRASALRTTWPQPSIPWIVASYVLLGVTVVHLSRRCTDKPREHEEEQTADATAPVNEWHASPLSRPLPTPVIRSWMRVGSTVLVLLWAGWLIWGYKPSFLDRNGYVQFLDVGQGDGILIRTGAGKHVLVDTGGTITLRKPGDEWRERRDPYEIGRKLLVPLLRQRGVRALDALVLTHLDADHIGGAEAVLRSVPVRAVIWNGTWKNGAATEKLFRAAEARGIPVYAAHGGMRWDIDGGASLQVLYPEESAGASAVLVEPNAIPALLREQDKQNEESVVLLLTLFGRRFLLSGDAESSSENAVWKAAAAAKEAPVDVMKAGHHGSKTSTVPGWLAYWKPSEVVISVGSRNRYGHPHASVVDRIAESGSLLYRTDRDGEIQYRVEPGGELFRRVKRLPGAGSPAS